MNSLEYISEFVLNIEDVRIEVLCDNPPDEIKNQIQKSQTNKPLVLHKHLFFEIFCIKDGPITMKFENELITFNQNSIAIIPPSVLHKEVESKDKSGEAIDCIIKPNKLSSSYPLYEKLMQRLQEPYAYFDDPTLHDTAHKLFCAVEAGEYPLISMLFHQFILLIIDAENKTSKNNDIHQSDSTNRRVYKIHQIIFRNYTKELRLETIADTLFLSTRQVNRLIKQHFGCTFKEYVASLRMNAASELLLTTNFSITEIYQKVGYNSAQAFYVAFQNHFSCTPVEYKNRHTAEQHKS